MPGPLDGIKVLDLTAFINGPSATGQMAENGATVLKVEPQNGEAMRSAAGAPGVYFAGYELYNRGKKSMTLDLKHPESLPVFKRLCQWADVLAENFKPGTMERLGLPYEVVKKWNPRLIYASNSGFGPKGEWSPRPSYDGMAQAFSGVLSNNAGGPSHSPRPIGYTFSDVVGGNYFYSAILAALVARGITGKGSNVVCSQLGATTYFQRVKISQVLDNKAGKIDDSGKHDWETTCFQQVHKAKDGKYVCISATKWDQFERFARDSIGRGDLLTSSVKKRWPVPHVKDRDHIIFEVGKTIAQETSDHWIDIMVANNVPCSPVSTYNDLVDMNSSVGRHMRDNNYLQKVNHRDYGELNWVGVPATFSATPNEDAQNITHAPYIGEHNDEILKILGYTNYEITQLKSNNVVPTPGGMRAMPGAKEARAKYAEKMRNRKIKSNL
eukprot:g1918.t1